MPKPAKPDHDVAAVVARLEAARRAAEECPMFPSDPPADPHVRIPAPHDTRGFVRLVGDLRTAQRRYFRTRSSADLDRAKATEAAVDAWLKDHGRQSRLDFGE